MYLLAKTATDLINFFHYLCRQVCDPSFRTITFTISDVIKFPRKKPLINIRVQQVILDIKNDIMVTIIQILVTLDKSWDKNHIKSKKMLIESFCVYNQLTGDRVTLRVSSLSSTTSPLRLFKKDIAQGGKACCPFNNIDCVPSRKGDASLELMLRFGFDLITIAETTRNYIAYCEGGAGLFITGSNFNDIEASCHKINGDITQTKLVDWVPFAISLNQRFYCLSVYWGSCYNVVPIRYFTELFMRNHAEQLRIVVMGLAAPKSSQAVVFHHCLLTIRTLLPKTNQNLKNNQFIEHFCILKSYADLTNLDASTKRHNGYTENSGDTSDKSKSLTPVTGLHT
ncbi:uncharacterized protein EV154DRAFT_553754 [Mucor mucedo]|uniref:uncharacterized protein n=1 Tax=Mucor mucedo TaxID=29922 RepID=UPI002220A934|nr:uncharacterized protein EV154DRAFT_553754 [Mucor mucedo]KAI7888532.1 hypothetical protein EV154DRAFT_553754 [Mucor mucedo]